MRATLISTVVLLLVGLPAATAQTPSRVQISVRILDCRTGHTVKGRWLSVYRSMDDLYSSFSSTRKMRVPPLYRVKASRRGVALIIVTPTLPSKLYVLSGENSVGRELDIAQVLRTGAVTTFPRCQPTYRPTAAPGEFVYWVYRPTFSELLWGLSP